jgi:hypothetical protein
VTDERRDHLLELAATALLALAAIATAWASYQSATWRGKQAEAQSASIAARVESTRQASVANRQAQVDLSLFTQWIDAYAHGETELIDFYRKHPEHVAAVLLEDRLAGLEEPAVRSDISRCADPKRRVGRDHALATDGFQ